MYRHTYVCMCIHIYIHTYVRAYIHTRKHIHIVYTQKMELSCQCRKPISTPSLFFLNYNFNPLGPFIPNFSGLLIWTSNKFREPNILYSLDRRAKELQNPWNLILKKLRRWRSWSKKLKEKNRGIFIFTALLPGLFFCCLCQHTQVSCWQHRNSNIN